MTTSSGDGSADRHERTLPYRLRANFLTPSEISLYRVLREVTQGKSVIFTKVALNEIFSIVRPNENVHYFNKLFRKYVDFLVCSPELLEPQAGVEIVHNLSEEGLRSADRFMDELFSSAGLPFIQVRAGEKFTVPELTTLFRQAFTRVKHDESKVVTDAHDSVPMCPICGKMMVLRTQSGGRALGRLYYGCVDNPMCPGRIAAG